MKKTVMSILIEFINLFYQLNNKKLTMMIATITFGTVFFKFPGSLMVLISWETLVFKFSLFFIQMLEIVGNLRNHGTNAKTFSLC